MKATAIKSIRDAVQVFKPIETSRAESQKRAGDDQEMKSRNALGRDFVVELFADNLEYFLMFCVIFTVHDDDDDDDGHDDDDCDADGDDHDDHDDVDGEEDDCDDDDLQMGFQWCMEDLQCDCDLDSAQQVIEIREQG